MKGAVHLKSFWDSTTPEHRSELLSLSLTTLRGQANLQDQNTGQQTYIVQLEDALEQLTEGSDWEQWQWGPGSPACSTAHAFRSYVRQQQVPKHQHLLQQDTDTPGTQRSRQELLSFLKALQTQLAALRESEELWKHAWRPPDKCAIISILFKSMEVEHPYLYNSFAAPVIHAVKALLPDCTSHINAPGEDQDYVLMLEDVERLEPNVVEPITMWLEQQLAHMIQVASGLVGHHTATAAAAPPRAFELAQRNSHLAVTDQWLRYLQESDASNDGIRANSSSAPEPKSAGPVLDWVYNTKGTSSMLPCPGQSVAHAFELLSRSLQHAQDWYDRADRLQTVPPTIQECQRLLKDWKGMDLRQPMSKGKQAGIHLAPAAVECMLRQETATAAAQAKYSSYQIHQDQQRVWRLNRQIDQRLRLHELLQKQHKKMDQLMRSPSLDLQYSALGNARQGTEMTVYWVQEGLDTEAAIGEVQTMVQEMDRDMDAAQLDITRHTKAFDQQQAWGGYVLDLLLRHSQATKLAAAALLGLRSSTEAANAQAELRAVQKCFREKVWPKMYPPKACDALCKAVQHQHKLLVQQYEDGLAVLPLIEAQVGRAAYRGPEACIIPQLILPLLRQHIESRAAEGHQNAASHSAAAGPLPLADLEAYYRRLLPQLSTPDPQGTIVSKLRKHVCCLQEAQPEKDCTELSYAPYVDDMLVEQAQLTPQTATSCQPVASSALAPRASAFWLMLLFCFNV